jgi:predicted DCC family thiol-disulfide oxidoreductase YuxK
MTSVDKPKKIQVFYDGKCPMCTVIMGNVQHSSKKDNFDLRDMHSNGEHPFDKKAVEKDIHVIGTDGKTYQGAEAILVIMTQYPRLKGLTTFGKLPFVKPLLPLGYRLISANRRFLFGPTSKIFWLKVTTLGAFIVGLCMSAKLWLSSRTYPLTPIFSHLPTINHPWDSVIFVGLILSALTAIFSPKPKKYIWGFLALLLVLCVLDETRLQPWVFQYGFLLIALALFSWDSEDEIGRTHVMNIARLVVASTYIFSGLQKVNLAFIERVFPWLVQPITNSFPFLALPLYLFGLLAPFVELAFGLGLLTKKYRRLSIVLAISMHVFILAMIGPFGLDWNTIIWPWTITMVIFDLLLFAGKDDFSFRDVLWTKGSPLHAAALILFGLLPFFSFFNLWDSYLSSALYSGNVTTAYVYTGDTGLSQLPQGIAKFFTPTAKNNNRLDIEIWSITELNVPPYPETRVYKNIVAQLCHYEMDPMQMTVVISENRLFGSTPETTYHCPEL